MIVKEEIPEGIIAELKSVYLDIDYSNYNGTLTKDIRTMRVQHREIIDNENSMVYLIRGAVTEDNVLRLYTVLESGMVSNK